jgi:hypothetical protein
VGREHVQQELRPALAGEVEQRFLAELRGSKIARSTSAARRNFPGREVMGGTESGSPHRLSKSPAFHLSYEFGALGVHVRP